MTREEIQNDVTDSIVNGKNNIIEVSMRVGKSRIAIKVIKRDKPKRILWVTNSPKLRDEDIPSEFIKWKAKTYLNKTNIVTYHKLSETIGSYDLIILDEMQELTPNRATTLLNEQLKADTILAMTGKLPTHKEKWEIFNQLKFKIVHRISIDDAADNDLIADYKVIVVETQLDTVNKNIEAGKKGSKFMQTEFNHYNYLSKIVNQAMYSNNKNWSKFSILNRLRFIYSLPSKLEATKTLLKHLTGRTLIFMGSIEHAEEVCKHTYHSKTSDKDLQDFLNGKINTLSCVNAGGSGFTFLNTDDIIIAQANSNKSGQISQKLTRSLTKQGDFKGRIWILSCTNTVDEKWVAATLEDLDKSKISYTSIKNFK